jgi:hypothetical protein
MLSKTLPHLSPDEKQLIFRIVLAGEVLVPAAHRNAVVSRLAASGFIYGRRSLDRSVLLRRVRKASSSSRSWRTALAATAGTLGLRECFEQQRNC